MIGPEHQGKGAGGFAMREMLRHAFMNLNLQRVESQVLAENTRSILLHEKHGFIREGLKRRALYKNGRFMDVVFFSILKAEFCDR